MLRMQAIDANTVASIDWQDGKFVDHVGKINWAQHGNFTSGNITKDTTYGNVFQGNGSAYWSANTSSLLPASSDMTVELCFKYTNNSHVDDGPWGMRNSDSLSWGDHTNAGVVLFKDSATMRWHRPYLLIKDDTLSINNWHHIVWSIENRRHYRAFLDGKLIADIYSTSYPNLGAFTFIAGGGSGGNNIGIPRNTFLAAVRISNKARYTSDFDAGGVDFG